MSTLNILSKAVCCRFVNTYNWTIKPINSLDFQISIYSDNILLLCFLYHVCVCACAHARGHVCVCIHACIRAVYTCAYV